MVVFVEEAIMDDPLLTKNPAFTPNIKEKLMTFTEGKDDLTDKIDFISKCCYRLLIIEKTFDF